MGITVETVIPIVIIKGAAGDRLGIEKAHQRGRIKIQRLRMSTRLVIEIFALTSLALGSIVYWARSQFQAMAIKVYVSPKYIETWNYTKSWLGGYKPVG